VSLSECSFICFSRSIFTGFLSDRGTVKYWKSSLVYTQQTYVGVGLGLRLWLTDMQCNCWVYEAIVDLKYSMQVHLRRLYLHDPSSLHQLIDLSHVIGAVCSVVGFFSVVGSMTWNSLSARPPSGPDTRRSRTRSAFVVLCNSPYKCTYLFIPKKKRKFLIRQSEVNEDLRGGTGDCPCIQWPMVLL